MELHNMISKYNSHQRFLLLTKQQENRAKISSLRRHDRLQHQSLQQTFRRS